MTHEEIFGLIRQLNRDMMQKSNRSVLSVSVNVLRAVDGKPGVDLQRQNALKEFQNSLL